MPTSAGSEEMGTQEGYNAEVPRSHHTEFWGLLSAGTWFWFTQHVVSSWGLHIWPWPEALC